MGHTLLRICTPFPATVSVVTVTGQAVVRTRCGRVRTEVALNRLYPFKLRSERDVPALFFPLARSPFQVVLISHLVIPNVE